MEPKFQTSFIPKTPITSAGALSSDTARRAIGSASFLPSLATIVFVLALIACGGLFAYQHVLNSQISDLNNTLVLAKSSFDPDTLNQVVTASDQIQSAKTLLQNHVAVSNVFALFEASVLPDVTFSEFDFGNDSNGNLQVSVTGEAASYAALEEQSSLFAAIPYMTNQSFSDLDVTSTGSISMKFQTDINQKVISYEQSVQTIAPQTVTQIQSAVGTTTAVNASTTNTTQ